MPLWLSLVIINRLFRKKKPDLSECPPKPEQTKFKLLAPKLLAPKLLAPWCIEIHTDNGKIYDIQDADIKNVNGCFTAVADFHIKDNLYVSTSMITYKGKFISIKKLDTRRVMAGEILRITHTIKNDATWGDKLLCQLGRDHLQNILLDLKKGKWKDGRPADFSPDMRKVILIEAARRGL